MPQPTQHSLLHVILLWITILSVVQIAFIILFFSAGQHGLSHNTTAPAGPMQFQANNIPSPQSSGNGKMLTFKAMEVKGNIKWVAKNPDQELVSEEEGGKVLKIKKDGYFFLTLQVTLYSCNASQDTVSLKKKDEVILQGLFNTNTCSTGLLGKVEEMSAPDTLEVMIDMETYGPINESLTHLDIIYMP